MPKYRVTYVIEADDMATVLGHLAYDESSEPREDYEELRVEKCDG